MAAGPSPLRVTLVADEMLGYTRTGGIGTATAHLALALGRMGHRVQLLYTGDAPSSAMSDAWARLYETAGVEIRILPRTGLRVEPSWFKRPREIETALAADPPDVVVAQDLAAPAYTALRMRQVGLAFPETLFVLYCHGGRRWITDMARKVRVLPGAHAVTLLEQACVELADVVVSPSAYLLEWMRGQRWQLPQRSLVIPYLSRSVATGELPLRATANGGGRVRRIAFFGRLEERKGLGPFAAGLNALTPELLANVELEFVGAPTPAWPPDRVESLLSERVRRSVRRISFATRLDQPEALAHLSRPGTLAVMPSHGESFSNAVYECLEHGIPFLASNAGAPAELVAPADRARVLFEPTPAGVTAALRRALSNGDALRPAQLAFDPATAYERWAKVVELRPQRSPMPPPERTDTVLVSGDDVNEEAQRTLERAQATTAADVVTCGVRLPNGVERLFHGDPGGLGLLANHYGTTALVRAELASTDEDVWPLFARLNLDGAEIVSIPRALVTSTKQPGAVETDPAAALAVVGHFERRLPDGLRGLARLTAGLAASATSPPARRSRLRRLLRR